MTPLRLPRDSGSGAGFPPDLLADRVGLNKKAV